MTNMHDGHIQLIVINWSSIDDKQWIHTHTYIYSDNDLGKDNDIDRDDKDNDDDNNRKNV